MNKQYLKVWTGYIQHGRDAGYPIKQQKIMGFDEVLEDLDTELDEKYYAISEISSDFSNRMLKITKEEKEKKRKTIRENNLKMR